MREDAPQERDDVSDSESAYQPPDPKKQISARVRLSVHSKLAAIVRLWKARARGQGKPEDEVDVTYVIDHLLADKTDTELAQWGGVPPNEEAWEKSLADIEADARSSQGSKKK